jgi:hypothetical protein
MEREEIVVTGDDEVGVASEGQSEELVVFGVARVEDWI